MSDPARVVELSPGARLELVDRKATCPFIGSAIAQGLLPVRNDADNPLARIDDLQQLGNQAHGDLGNLLAMFAAGNHGCMRDDADQLACRVPEGLFSLDFPDSQGAHPGDSGILQGGPQRRRPFQFSEPEFARLASRATQGRLSRSAIGGFIAENVRRDPRARTLGREVVVRMGHDLFELFEASVPAVIQHLVGLPAQARAAHRTATERLTRLLAEDNIVGSSGEFGLLFALLSGRPGAGSEDGEPVLLLDELRLMFQHKQLPNGWDQIRKTRIDWAKHTLAIAFNAYESFAKG